MNVQAVRRPRLFFRLRAWVRATGPQLEELASTAGFLAFVAVVCFLALSAGAR